MVRPRRHDMQLDEASREVEAHEREENTKHRCKCTGCYWTKTSGMVRFHV